MQITLNVEGSQLDAEVKSLLETLTLEQKNQMAVQLLEKSLGNTGSEMKREIAAKKIADEWNSCRDQYKQVSYTKIGWCRKQDPSRAVDWEEHRELDKRLADITQMGNWFRNDVMKSMLEYGQNEVKNLVANDPTIKEAVAQTVEAIKQEMPKIVHDAMIAYFCGQMTNMAGQLSETLFQTGTNAKLLTEMRDKLSQQGVY